jgi:peptide/nickel transport system substrate-binding protein
MTQRRSTRSGLAFHGTTSRRLLARAGAPIMVAALLIGGCSSSSSPSSSGSATGSGTGVGGSSAKKPAVIDDLKLGLATPVSIFDPGIQSDNATGEIRILTSGQLYRQDRNGVAKPELVQSSTTSADGLTVTMTMKPSLKYSDGTAVLAGDVVNMYKHAVLSVPGGSPMFTPFVKSVTAPDDRTVVWHLKQRYAQLPLALGQSSVLLHPAAEMKKSNYFKAPVSAGPYMIDNFKAGDQIMHLVENPHYVGGALMVKKIDSVAVADPTQMTLQVQSKQLDFAWGLPYSSVASMKKVSGVTVLLQPTGGVFQLGLNTTNGGPLGNATVRRAISLAVDRSDISQKAFLGVAEPNPAWVNASSPAYAPVLPDGGKRDVAAAKKLLATTPYAKGFSFAIDTFGQREGHTATVTLIKAELADIGIKVTVNPLETQASLDRLNNNTFQAFFQGSVAPTAPSVMATDFCVSGVWGRWMPSGIPAICNMSIAAASDADPSAALVKVEKLALTSMPIVPLLNRRDVVATRVPVADFGPVANTPWLAVATVASVGK